MKTGILGLCAVGIMGVSTASQAAVDAFLTFTPSNPTDMLTENVSLNFAKVIPDYPVTAPEILSFSWGATGNINFAATSIANSPSSPTVTCTGNCFETTANGLMQMNPGDSATFSANGETVMFKPTSTPDVLSVEWFKDCAPSVVDTGKGTFSVPEPGTLSLLGLGLLGVMVRRRRTA